MKDGSKLYGEHEFDRWVKEIWQAEQDEKKKKALEMRNILKQEHSSSLEEEDEKDTIEVSKKKANGKKGKKNKINKKDK